MDVDALRGRRQRRWAGEGCTHQHQPLEDIGPHQRRVGRDRGAEIVADHGFDRAVAQRRHHAHGVAQQIEEAEGGEVAVVVGVPAGGAAVAALVGRKGVVARCRQRRQHLAPAIGKLGETVQQQHRWAAWTFMTGLQHMDVEPVDAGQDPRADAGGQDGSRQGIEGGHGGVT